jgi:hypothetical protein
MITDAEVLKALQRKHGQYKIVAKLLGLAHAQQLHWWVSRPSGVAWQWRERVYQLALKAGVKLPKAWLTAKPSGAKPMARKRRRPKSRPTPRPKSRPRRAHRNGYPAAPRPSL